MVPKKMKLLVKFSLAQKIDTLIYFKMSKIDTFIYFKINKKKVVNQKFKALSYQAQELDKKAIYLFEFNYE